MNPEDRFARFAFTGAARANLRIKSVRGAMFTACGGAIDVALRVASTLVLARLLIPEHFGLVGMVIAVTGIAENLSSMGLSTATVQAPEITHRQCSNLFWINVAAGILFGVVICATAPLLSAFYGDGRLTAITVAISTNFVWGGLTIQHEALLNRQMRQPHATGNRLAANFLSICVAVVLALGGQGYWALVWREVTRSFFVAVGVWLLCRWVPGLPSRGTRMGSLLRFGRDMTLTQFLISVITRLDALLIGKFAGPFALGLYRQAQNLMAPLGQVNAPIYSVSQPGLSMLQSDPDRYRRYYQRILLVVAMATIPFGVFTAIYAQEIAVVVLGEKWIGTAVFLQILGLAAIIRPAMGTSGIVLVTTGRSGRFLVLVFAHSLVLALLMAIGIPWGAEGIVLAHVSTSALFILPNLYYSFAGTPVSVADFFTVVSRPFFASALMALVLAGLRGIVPLGNGLACLLAGCGTAIVVYFVSLAIYPGGWLQLRGLFQDAMAGLRHRYTRAGGTQAPAE